MFQYFIVSNYFNCYFDITECFLVIIKVKTFPPCLLNNNSPRPFASSFIARHCRSIYFVTPNTYQITLSEMTTDRICCVALAA